jgi:hypothetical protein
VQEHLCVRLCLCALCVVIIPIINSGFLVGVAHGCTQSLLNYVKFCVMCYSLFHYFVSLS